MNTQQRGALCLRDTDIDGAVRRLCGDEDLYIACLKDFLSDRTVADLNVAIKSGKWDDAFTQAHALKGMAGNMGFVPLMHATGQLVVLLRGGRIKELGESLESVNSCYRDIIDAITMNFDCAGDKNEGAKEHE